MDPKSEGNRHDKRLFVPSEDGAKLADDTVWATIRAEVIEECDREPLLQPKLYSAVVSQRTLEGAVANLLASLLTGFNLSPSQYVPMFYEAFTKGTTPSGEPLGQVMRKDLVAVNERDPACPSLSHALLFFKGFQGLQAHRVAHWLWGQNRRTLASLIQSRMSLVFGMDLHPAARLGHGIMIDHATGIVVGETSVIGDDCSLLHGVTLGGTGKATGDRHPKIGRNVVIGAGATILGNIKVGDNAKIAACSVVVKAVPPNVTVAGCPAKVVGGESKKQELIKVDSPPHYDDSELCLSCGRAAAAGAGPSGADPPSSAPPPGQQGLAKGTAVAAQRDRLRKAGFTYNETSSGAGEGGGAAAAAGLRCTCSSPRLRRPRSKL